MLNSNITLNVHTVNLSAEDITFAWICETFAVIRVGEASLLLHPHAFAPLREAIDKAESELNKQLAVVSAGA